MKPLTMAIVNKLLAAGLVGKSKKLEVEMPSDLGLIRIVAHDISIMIEEETNE